MKTANELFEEAKHIVGIENLNSKEIRHYLWNGEAPSGEKDQADKATEDEILYSPKYSNERYDAVIGVLIDRFGYYMSEIDIENVWFCNLRGRNICYISSSNKYFVRSVYWKAAAAKDRLFRAIPWIPIAANPRKIELERRLANTEDSNKSEDTGPTGGGRLRSLWKVRQDRGSGEVQDH